MMTVGEQLTVERPRHSPRVEISRLLVLNTAVASSWRHCRRPGLASQQPGDALRPAKDGRAALRARQVDIDCLAVQAGAQVCALLAWDRGRACEYRLEMNLLFRFFFDNFTHFSQCLHDFLSPKKHNIYGFFRQNV
jgi:hypothetical protein